MTPERRTAKLRVAKSGKVRREFWIEVGCIHGKGEIRDNVCAPALSVTMDTIIDALLEHGEARPYAAQAGKYPRPNGRTSPGETGPRCCASGYQYQPRNDGWKIGSCYPGVTPHELIATKNHLSIGAGEGNRTLVISLEACWWLKTIRAHSEPQAALCRFEPFQVFGPVGTRPAQISGALTDAPTVASRLRQRLPHPCTPPWRTSASGWKRHRSARSTRRRTRCIVRRATSCKPVPSPEQM